MRKLKVVIDTSVFVAGMLTRNRSSNPAQIIELWKQGAFTLVMAPQILSEVVAVFIDKGIDENAIVDFVASTAAIALNIPGVYETTRLDTVDVTDNKFLAAAYESSADYLVSLDNQSLLPLKHFYGTQIVTPTLFVRAIAGAAEEEVETEGDAEFLKAMHELESDMQEVGNTEA